jgi:hypothetical protein
MNRFLYPLTLATAAWAQESQISGVIQDTSGGRVPEAAITTVQDESGTRREVRSDPHGNYSIFSVRPGTYKVTARKEGFQTTSRTGVKIDVAESARIDFTLEPSGVAQAITVEAAASPATTDSATVSTVINRQFIENLPLNGRSFQSLIALTPGVVLTPATFGEQGQFSVNGQRANANYFTIDGASANIGVSAGLTLVQSASGSLPGFGANGGTNTLVAVEAIEEFRVQTSSYAPEYGRTPGAQVSIVTRAGGNQFHGALFDFFRNDALDAQDWFANASGLPKPALRQNDFGGALGGPVLFPKLYDGHNRTFFFFSYEGLRLLQPQVETTDVPSLYSRSLASDALAPYLDSFPLPNRPAGNSGFAPFVASYTDRSALDATSLRIDHALNERISLFGRYNYAPSLVTARLYALSNPTDTTSGTTTLTLGATFLITPSLSNELRLNYSHTTGASLARLDTFGGATPISPSTFFPPFADLNDSFGGFFLTNGVNSSYYLGKNVSNSQRQYNLIDTISFLKRSHQLRFGIDYRRIGTYNGARSYDELVYFVDPLGAAEGLGADVMVEAQDPGSIRFDNLSLFTQDAWKITPRWTLTYGVRWELNPAPGGGPNHPLYTFENYDQPKNLSLAPAGTPLYKTTWTNFAPRLGLAHQLGKGTTRQTTLRAGFGMFYDLGSGLLGQSAASFPYYRLNSFYQAMFPLPAQAAIPPPFSLTGPVSSIYGAVRGLQLPVTYEWNVALEKSFDATNMLTVSYVGAAGRRLLRMDYFVNPNANFQYAYLVRNTGFSDFESLQVQFQRRLSKGLQLLASYTYSHSLDNASNDSTSYLYAIQLNPQRDRASSDFDIRHALSAAFSYELGHARRRAVPFRDWFLDGVVVARSSSPVDITYTRDLGYGVYSFRPDLVVGEPLYLSDPNVAGGRRFNPDAFALQNSFPGREGTLGRNVLRGFPLNQINVTVRREFALLERLKLQFRAEMFNVLNHANFANPTGDLFSPEFGYSTQMLSQNLGRGGVNGGLNPLYQVGGPRSIQLALRLVF